MYLFFQFFYMIPSNILLSMCMRKKIIDNDIHTIIPQQKIIYLVVLEDVTKNNAKIIKQIKKIYKSIGTI